VISKEITVTTTDILDIYCDVYNLFSGLDKKSLLDIIIGKTPSKMLEQKKSIVLRKIVKALDDGASIETKLKILPSSFDADLKEIIKTLEVAQ